MLRINDSFLDCVVYVYPSEDTAQSGRFSGGTGFLVRIPSMGPRESFTYLDSPHFHYVVTSKHILESVPGKDVFIRLNNQQGQFEVKRIPKRSWESSEDDDLAAAFVEFDANHFRFLAIDRDRFLPPRYVSWLNFGIGDFVFLVGRFVNVEGIQKNKPCVRIGNISMMPDESALISIRGVDRPAFLVEMRTRSGFSGSPVFLKIPELADFQHHATDHNQGRYKPNPCGPWLIGVHAGQVPLTGAEMHAEVA